MPVLQRDLYFEARPVEHSQQGDIHRNVSKAYTLPAAPPKQIEGKRRRPAFTESASTVTSTARWAVVCSYTCGFLAQPPGTKGYAHPYRLVAELRPIRDLVQEDGLTVDQARGILREGGAHGLMYMPLPEPDAEDENADDEWTGSGAILLYAPWLTTQSHLDESLRVARLSPDAQRILIARLWQTTGPYMPEPNDTPLEPDTTDGWSDVPGRSGEKSARG